MTEKCDHDEHGKVEGGNEQIGRVGRHGTCHEMPGGDRYKDQADGDQHYGEGTVCQRAEQQGEFDGEAAAHIVNPKADKVAQHVGNDAMHW